MNPTLAYALQLVVAYITWAGLGWLFGWHWIVLLVAVSIGRKAEQCWTRESCVTLLYFVLWWTALLILAIGGGYVRSNSYTGCKGGEEMSRRCLFAEQPADYVVIYVAHFIGLGWMATMWVFDGLQLPLWVLQASRGQPLHVLGSDKPLGGPTYTAIVAGTTLVVTLTWTAIVDWTTDGGGVQGLALALFLEIVAATLVAAAVLHRARVLALVRGKKEVAPPSEV